MAMVGGADEVREVYADGGVVLRNPSDVGGTWAWCHVNALGARVRGDSGVVTPAGLGRPQVTNNVTEFLAVLLALEALPAGWSGEVSTDSNVTVCRFRYPGGKTNGLPDDLVARQKVAVARLGKLWYRLLGGHPSRVDLARGCRKDGLPVSDHNVWCDRQCKERATELVVRLARPEVA